MMEVKKLNTTLRVFVEVVERGNFSRAAEALYMTQPAVSQYIKSLERDMGVQVLDRSNKVIRLTKEGRIVYEHAKEMIGHFETMHHLLHDLEHEPKGELSIGASYTFGEYVLPRVIAQLLKEYPGIQPSITIGNTQEIAEQVEDMKLDIGIVEGDVDDAQLQVESLATDRMCIIASHDHPLAQEGHVKACQLEEETWIIREKGSGTREATEKLFEQMGIDPAHRMEFGSTQIIKESVEAGLGVTLLSLWAIRKELSINTLATMEVEKGALDRDFSILLKDKPMQTRSTLVLKEVLKKFVGHSHSSK